MLQRLWLLIVLIGPSSLRAQGLDRDLEVRRLPRPGLRAAPVPPKAHEQTAKQQQDRAEAYRRALEEPEIVGMHIDEKDKSDLDDWPTRMYIDPDLHRVRITKEPGQSWRDCALDAAACVAQATPKTRITRVPGVKTKVREEINVATGEPVDVEYVKVRFEDENGVGEGWMDTSSLRPEQLAPIYNTEKELPSNQKVCFRPTQGGDLPANQLQLGQVAEAIEGDARAQLETSTESLRDFVGRCPLKDPQHKKSAWQGKNVYDFEVYPKLAAQQGNFPSVLKESAQGQVTPQKASLDDVVAIDTLARTLYSEMNECFAVGLQYPMAVAKIALNRAKDYEADKKPPHFVGGPQIETKPTLSKVLTARSQFAVWTYDEARPRDKTLLMSLCPAKDAAGKENWKGGRPTPDELDAWDLSLKIATEAVLFPKRFEKKTGAVTQVYYSSKMRTNGDFKRPEPPPKIEGRAVKSLRCMYLWEEKK